MERLLDFFVPESYKIEWKINKETEVVQGRTVIKGEKREKQIRLHAKGLKIKEVKENEREVEFRLEEAQEEMVIEGEAGLGKVELEIKYEFSLSHNMEGVYVSTYEYQGRKEKIVSTQFESHYAREGFPCIDEPAGKATFEVKIESSEAEDEILGNMPIAKEEKGKNGGRIVVFGKTPRMSTYLLAFCIGKMQKVEGETKDGVKVRTWAGLNQEKENLKFPNEVAVRAIEFYNEKFGVKYPLPKLDQVAIPDFEAGAMENWGLVTYREVCLLAGEKTSQTDKEYVATVITHELSHQWFGNLVTMKWWDDLWLNESFANIMEYYCVDHLFPEWQIWQGFFIHDCYYALKRDALEGVQAVRQEVEHPDEIATLFDGAIVYAKGARLMLMLMRLMGEENFLAGVRDYLEKFKYKNTVGRDLWSMLQRYAEFEVKEFMKAWIKQSGYPVIVGKKQERFLLSGAKDATKWPVPKITDDMTGHYVIWLDEEEFKEKMERFETLNLEQKIRLLMDRQLLMKTKRVETASIVDLLMKFRQERSEAVWELVVGAVGAVKMFCVPGTESFGWCQKMVEDLTKEMVNEVGLEPRKGEKAERVKIRQIVLGLAIYAEDKQVIRGLAKIFDEVKGEVERINPEIRGAVLMAKMRVGAGSEEEKEASEEEILELFLEKYKKEAQPAIKEELLEAITMVREPKNREKVVALLGEEIVVKPQDRVGFLAGVLANYWTRGEAYAWLYQHWEDVIKATSGKSLDDYVRVASAYVRTRVEEREFETFFAEKGREPAIERSVKVAKGEIESRLEWLERDKVGVWKKLKEGWG